VSLGAYNKSDPADRKDVITAVVHSSFDVRASYENDIGLLKLSSDVIFNGK